MYTANQSNTMARTTGPSLLNKRIAKIFDKQLYFGTITKYNTQQKFWCINYDDGDYEEMEFKDLNVCLKLYDDNIAKDTNKVEEVVYDNNKEEVAMSTQVQEKPIDRRDSTSMMKEGGDIRAPWLMPPSKVVSNVEDDKGDGSNQCPKPSILGSTSSNQGEDTRAPWLKSKPSKSKRAMGNQKLISRAAAKKDIKPKERKEGPKDAATLLNELVDYIDQENITDLESGIVCVELDFIVYNVLCAELKRVAISPNILTLLPFLEYWSQYKCQALFNRHSVAAHVIHRLFNIGLSFVKDDECDLRVVTHAFFLLQCQVSISFAFLYQLFPIVLTNLFRYRISTHPLAQLGVAIPNVVMELIFKSLLLGTPFLVHGLAKTTP